MHLMPSNKLKKFGEKLGIAVGRGRSRSRSKSGERSETNNNDDDDTPPDDSRVSGEQTLQQSHAVATESSQEIARDVGLDAGAHSPSDERRKTSGIGQEAGHDGKSERRTFQDNEAVRAMQDVEKLVQTHEGNDKVLRLQRAVRPALEIVAQINQCVQQLSGVDPTGILGPVCAGVDMIMKAFIHAPKFFGYLAYRFEDIKARLKRVYISAEALKDSPNIQMLADALSSVSENIKDFNEKLKRALDRWPILQQISLAQSTLPEYFDNAENALQNAERDLVPVRDEYLHKMGMTLDEMLKTIDGTLARQDEKQDKMLDKQDELLKKQQEVLELINGKLGSDKLPYEVRLFVEKVRATRVERKESEAIKQVVEDWLSPTDPLEDLHRLRSNTTHGTCEWIKSHDKIMSWRAPEQDQSRKSHLLWMKGKLGSGKSSLIASLVRDLENDSFTDSRRKIPLAYFFCLFGRESKRTARTILATLTWQVFAYKDEGLKTIRDKFGKMLRSEANRPQILELLKYLVRDSPITRIVVDGLDECPKDAQEAVLRDLGELQQNCTILISSRNEGMIEREVHRLGKIFEVCDFELSEDKTRGDLRAFIQQESDSLLQGATQQAKFQDELLDRSQGIFQYVRVVIDLLQHRTILGAEVLEAMKKLPPGLDELYERVISRIYDESEVPPSNREILEQTLRFVKCAARPLSLIELAILIPISLGKQDKDELPPGGLRSVIIQNCGSLFQFSPVDGGGEQSVIVSVAHASVSEYLVSSSISERTQFSMDQGSVHASMAKACLKYVMHRSTDIVYEVDNNLESSHESLEKHSQAHPFLEYATIYWWWHSFKQDCYTNEDFQRSWRIFFSDDGKHIVRWLQMFHYYFQKDRSDARKVAKAIWFRFKRPQKQQSGDTIVWNMNPSELPEGEVWAKHLGWPTGAKTSRWSMYAWTGSAPYYLPIGIAAHFNFANLVESYLAEDNARLEAVNSSGETPLYEAARGHSFDAFSVLMHYGANINGHRHVHRETILSAAVNHGWKTSDSYPVGPNHIVMKLLENGVKVDPRLSGKRTILHEFARSSDEGWESDEPCVREIFKRNVGQLLFKQGSRGLTPIHEAAKWGSSSFLAFVLDTVKGSRKKRDLLDLRNSLGRSALHDACRSQRSESSLQTVKVLLEHGAKPDCHGDFLMQRPLHHAMVAANSDIVELLLEAHAKVDARDWSGRTPLHIAASKDLAHIIDILVDHGASLETKDDEDQTPLECAYIGWKHEAVKALLAKGASPSRIPSLKKAFNPSIVLSARKPNPLPKTLKCSCDSNGEPQAVPFLVQHDTNDTRLPLLASFPIMGRSQKPVTRITINILSKDQGWSSYPDRHGKREHVAPSYHEAWVMKGAGSGWHQGPIICRNRHAGKEKEWQTVVWSAETGVEKGSYCDSPASREAIPRFLADLEPGDILGVLARAASAGWENHTYRVEMEIECVVE